MNESMKTELNALFGDVLNCPLTKDRARLFVIMDGIRFQFEPSQGKFIVEEMTVFFKMRPRTGGETLNGFDQALPLQRFKGPIGSVDPRGHLLQQVQKLTPVLARTQPRDQEEILLITWDHGSGFGIFRDDEKDGDNPDVRTSIMHQLDQFPYLKIFWDKASENSDFTKFVKQKMAEKPSVTLSFGETVHRIVAEDEASAFFVDLLKDGKNTRFARLATDAGKGRRLEFDQQYYASLPPGQVVASLSEDLRERLKHQLDQQKVPAIALPTDGAPEILMNRELAQVLKTWLGDRKVGVVAMMNCWMMNLHTLYSLRNTVKFLVAPESNIDCPGLNYRDILQAACDGSVSPDDAKKMANLVVSSSHNAFLRKRAAELNTVHPETIDYRSLMAAQLDYPAGQDSPLDKLIKQLKSLIGMLNVFVTRDANGPEFYWMQFIRNLSLDFTVTVAPMVDLPNYLYYLYAASDQLQETVADSDFRTLAQAVQASAQNDLPMLQPRFIGDKWFFLNYAPAVDVSTGKTPTGYSIFFPKARAADEHAIDNAKSDELLTTEFSQWKDLLFKLYGLTIG